MLILRSCFRIFYICFLVGGKKITCKLSCKQNDVPIYFLTSEVTSLYASDTLLMLTFPYSPLYLIFNQCFPSQLHTIPPQCVNCMFRQAYIVRNHCLHLFSGNRCTFVFSCMQIQQVLSVSFPCYLYLYAVSPCESLKGHTCTTTDLAAFKPNCSQNHLRSWPLVFV